jgi:hypothetical protein
VVVAPNAFIRSLALGLCVLAPLCLSVAAPRWSGLGIRKARVHPVPHQANQTQDLSLPRLHHFFKKKCLHLQRPLQREWRCCAPDLLGTPGRVPRGPAAPQRLSQYLEILPSSAVAARRLRGKRGSSQSRVQGYEQRQRHGQVAARWPHPAAAGRSQGVEVSTPCGCDVGLLPLVGSSRGEGGVTWGRE